MTTASFRSLAMCLGFAALGATGCRHPSNVAPNERSMATSARGVSAHLFKSGSISGDSDAAIIDVDLAAARVKPTVISRNPAVKTRRIWAETHTVKQWCEREGAIAGINGGFFGLTDGRRKEVIGLLAREEEIVSSGQIVRSPRNPRRRVVRSVLGFDRRGLPHIGWAVGERSRAAVLTEYRQPLNPTQQRFWTVDSAVGCGPRLIKNGKINVTDREEILVDPYPLPRTFAAYSEEAGRPRRLVLGVADSMTFRDAAAFLDRYFKRRYGTECAEAMCLDGGSSSQLVYRTNSGLVEYRRSTVTVPSAVLIVPR